MAAATMEELHQIFENFTKNMLSGEVEKALSFRDQSSAKSILEAIKTPEEKASTLQMFRMMSPISSKAEHLDQKDQKALLYLTAIFPNPEQPGQTVAQELMLNFSVEENVWKLGNINFLLDLNSIKRSADEKFEPESNFESNKTVSIGGRLISIKFDSAYTMAVVRVIDEDYQVYFPAKADLPKIGLTAEQLTPWKILQISVHSHPQNSFKYLGVKAEIIEPSFD